MTSEAPIVIVGASHAGVSLALQLRKEGWQGGIQLVGAEHHLPYHRPPLTKDFLAGNKEAGQIQLRPEKVYTDNDIELRLGCHVAELDTQNKLLKLESDEGLAYLRLALCVGARERKLPFGNELSGLHYVRSLDNVAALQQSLPEQGNVVIIGGGYIGLEAAAVLRQAGHQVTVLEMADRILQRVTCVEMSEYMTSLHEANGVRIVTGTEVSDIVGKSRVETVRTESGQQYPADVVIVGIGVIPNSELAQSAGITVDDGIVVDQYTRTSAKDVFAAGDCTRYPSTVYQRSIRLESVQNANDQARAAAANMAGKQQAYDALPWFWSDQYQVKLQMAGLSEGYDQVVSRGKPELTNDEGFALFYLKQGQLLAADCVNRPQDFMASKALISRRVTPDMAALQNPAISLKEISA